MNTNPTPAPLVAAAQDLHAHGIRVIPVRSDGTKAPALRAWQDHHTSAQDIEAWFGPGGQYTAMGAVMGPASGNLEMTEIEGEYTHQLAEVHQLAQDTGLAGVWSKLTNGWVEQSPSGGIHWIYRVAGMEVPGNTKLAQDAPRTVDGKRTVPTIAETRGRGGQAVVSPTGGHAHPTGRPWVRLSGGPATIATITPEERDQFHTLLRTLDRRPAPTNNPHPSTPGNHTATQWGGVLAELEATTAKHRVDGTTPGDDYEQRTSWAEILEPEGWTRVFQRGHTTYWRRPGKNEGFSATTGHADDRDRLYVFSSSTPFPTEEPITKFSAYAILNHAGNHSAAASRLKGDGYGKEERTTLPAPQPAQQAQAGPAAPPAAASTGGAQVQGNNVIQMPAPEDRPHLEAVTTTLGLTDDSNAADLIRLYGDRLRYNSDHGRWLVWQGHVWEVQPRGGGYAREMAKNAARQLGENDDKQIKHKRYSLSERGITACLNTACTDSSIAVTTRDLDAHPMELNTPGGIVDLTTGQLRPADPARLHTRSTAATPDPGADSEPWEKFLVATFPDQEIRGYVQRLVGHSLLGEVRSHVLPFCHGSGGNGKGVFLEALMGVLGNYAGPAPQGFLMVTPYPQHATELADLAGQRFVVASEVNEDDKFDEAKVKQLTGGDTIKARFMRQDQFQFTPTHSLWLMGNDQPAVNSGGDAFWRRCRLIPFTNRVKPQDVVEGLQRILAEEHGGAVLAWAVQGAVEYLAYGLEEPEGVKAATAAYAENTDTIGKFLEDECIMNPSMHTPVSQLRSAYESWCKDNGERPIAGRRFTAQLQRHGVRAGREAPRAGGIRMYGGVALVTREEEPMDLSGTAWKDN